jgi:hypothetical protein
LTVTNEAKRNEDTVEPLVRLRIEVVGEDGDACRKLLRDLCDMVDADLAGAPGYSVSTIEGSASCDVETVPNARNQGLAPQGEDYD